jgi:VWFA-related protein
MPSKSHPKRTAPVAGALLTLFAAVFAFGQSAPQKSPPAPTVPSGDVVRVTARLVQVSVTAQDKFGKPVTDLTQDDFTVLDQGATQKISIFTPPIGPSAISTANVSKPGNDFSNLTQPDAPPSITVILLDVVNTGLGDLSYAQTQVLKFARQAHPQDQIALYIMTPVKLDVLHDFTTDSSALLRVMSGTKPNATKPDPDVAATNAAYKRMNNAIGDAFVESYRYYPKYIDRPRVTFYALQAIAKRLSAIPGRKNLVWISDSFPINLGYVGGSSPDETGHVHPAVTLSYTAKTLNDANIYVYPVEARGPTGENIMPVIDKPGLLGSDINKGKPAPTLNGAAPNEKMFRAMGIADAIRNAADDSRLSYMIGYYPDHNKWDGSFREIKVKVNRPGIILRYRGGYLATEDGTDVAAQHKLALVDAILSPVQLMGLGLEVHAEPAPESSGDRQIKVNIRISGDQLRFDHDGDRWKDSIEVAWAELSADGRIVAHGEHAFGISPAQSGYEDILRDGLSFSEHVSVDSEAVEMRLVVRDMRSFATGSVNFPLANVFAPPPPQR